MSQHPTGPTPLPPDPRLEVILWGTRKKRAPAVRCRTDLVTPTAVRVRVPRDLGPVGGRLRETRIQRLRTRLEKVFGRDLRLRVATEGGEVWSGPVRLCGVELPPNAPAEILLTLAFVEPLDEAARIAFGVDPRIEAERKDPVETDVALPWTVVEAPQPDAPAPAGAAGQDRRVHRRTAPDRRGADRVEVGLPVQIHAATGALSARLRDLSRTGLCLTMERHVIECQGARDLGAIASAVNLMIGPRFGIYLHHRMLGSLLGRTLTLTRLAVAPGEGTDIELSGYFDLPLESEETALLGVPLPPPLDSEEEWCPRADLPAPHHRRVASEVSEATVAAPRPSESAAEPTEDATPSEDDVSSAPESEDAGEERAHAKVATARPSARLHAPESRGYRVVLRPRSASGPAAVTGRTDLIAREGVRLRLGREHALPQAPEQRDNVAMVTARFADIFGTRVTVQLADRGGRVWTGPTTLCAVELPRDRPDEVVVTLLFERPLHTTEFSRLRARGSAA